MVGETLHATDVLNNNFESIQKLLLAAYRKYVPKVDESEREDFCRHVVARVIDAAKQFDTSRGIEFSTYAYKFIDGAARDWRAGYFGIDLKTGERYASRSKNISIDAPIGSDEEGEPLTIGDTLADPELDTRARDSVIRRDREFAPPDDETAQFPYRLDYPWRDVGGLCPQLRRRAQRSPADAPPDQK